MEASTSNSTVDCTVVTIPSAYFQYLAHNTECKTTQNLKLYECGSNSVIINEQTFRNLGFTQRTRLSRTSAVWASLKFGLRYVGAAEDGKSLWCIRPVQIVNDQGIPNNTVVISEDLLQNLFGESDQKILFSALSKIRKPKMVIINEFHNGNNQPQRASKVVLSLYQQDLENTLIDGLLNKYFSYPRYLCKGDIFSVYVRDTFVPDLLKHVKLDTVYFKVSDIQGFPNGGEEHLLEPVVYAVDSSVAVYQSSGFQGFLPLRNIPVCYNPNLFSLLADARIMSRLTEHNHCLVPPAFDEVFNTICQWMEPFLFSSDKVKEFELSPVFLVAGQNGSGKALVSQALSQYFRVRNVRVDCAAVGGAAPGQAEGKIKAIFSQLKSSTPCILHLSNIESLFQDAESNVDVRVVSCFEQQVKEFNSNWPVVILATTHNVKCISSGISNLFLDKISLNAPSCEQRENIIEWLVWYNGAAIDSQVLKAVASQTSGFAFRDLEVLIALAFKEKFKRCQNESTQNAEFLLIDFNKIIEVMHKAYSESIGAPKVPSVLWKDVGGLESLKKEILRSLRSNMFSTGLKRSGLLLHGPPGTGKTLLAKAVATQCNRNFLSVKGPELLNMYVGQSEQNVRDLFELAKVAAPCIVFFDELDSLAPNRGRSGDSGGVMDRVVSQLLAEMDDLGASGDIFILGATNRPDLIDPALLRPGRLDKLLYVGPCEDRKSQLSVMTAVTHKLHLADNVDLEELVSQLPGSVSGAQISALCSAAWLSSARQLITSGDHKQKTDVVVDKSHFVSALGTVFS